MENTTEKKYLTVKELRDFLAGKADGERIDIRCLTESGKRAYGCLTGAYDSPFGENRPRLHMEFDGVGYENRYYEIIEKVRK